MFANLELDVFFDIMTKRFPCPCGEMVKETDFQGLWCEACDNTFCSDCNAQPYHEDKTCIQHKYTIEHHACRYCDIRLEEPSAVKGAAFINVCKGADCVQVCEKYCCKMRDCGHPCMGFKNEGACKLPCLHPECVQLQPELTFGVNWETTCSICLEPLNKLDSCIINECKHIYHTECIMAKIKTRWEPGTPVQINFMKCPCCNINVNLAHHPKEHDAAMIEAKSIVDVMKRQSVHVAKIQGLDQDERL